MRKTMMLGNVGRDPETRYTPAGIAVTNFSLADTERWDDKETGEKKERTEWVRWVAFGRQAEIIGEHVKKGALIYCEGKQQTRDYMKDGVKTYTTEVKLKEFHFASSKQDKHPGEKPLGNNGPAPSRDFDNPPPDDFDDGVPF